MHLKRYLENTVEEALEKARAELGAGALVLSARVVARPGWRGWLGAKGVEVTAAVDAPVSAVRPPGVPRRHETDPVGTKHAVVARLCASGLDRALAEDVYASLPVSWRRSASSIALERALAVLLEKMTVGEEAPARVEAFVGPPGAGKTTTVAKIAALARVRRRQRLGLVAADGFRVGAVEQLRLYADIIGGRFMVARTPDDVARAIDSARAPILVDTAGRPPEASAALFDVLASRPDVRTHLVLPAGTTPSDAERIFDGYRAARPTRVVLTKIDQTNSLAPLVGLLRERAIPVSYLADGQRVPDDLRAATGSLFAACVIGGTTTPAVETIQ
jgi:flagellar biosynthesis protein FlhF